MIYQGTDGIYIDESAQDKIKFNDQGLIPAVIQDYRNNEVLMLAYMNGESLQKTLETGKCTYYSRSRQQLWLKGETSGHFQQVREIYYDCDVDTLLIKVDQTGAACHTGERTCFYRKVPFDPVYL
ncbi:MAG: phosphoribosyl-AMP cyclohydrolase [bacterium]